MRGEFTTGSVEQFASYINVTADHWWWTGMKDRLGYGYFRTRRTPQEQWLAHRLMWTLVNGPIPKGMVIRHLCNTSSCVNPDHLAIGTQKDNMHDAIKAGNHASVQIRDRFLSKSDEERLEDQRRHRQRRYERRDVVKEPKGYVRGDTHPRAKLTEADVRAIRQRHARGESRSELACEYGVTHQHIHAIIKRHAWNHVE